MNKYKTIITTIVIVVFSFIIGYISNDIFIGSIALSSGILNIWFEINGKSINYIFGCVFYILNSYISYKNNLFGLFLLSLIIYLPLNIIGFIAWNKNKDTNNKIQFRKCDKFKSINIIISSLLLSFLFGILLSINPKQKLNYLDSSSNILNIFSCILINKRLNEGFIILLFNNIIDLIIWIVNYLHKNKNSFMMMLVSIFYLVINIYGIYKFKKNKKTS